MAKRRISVEGMQNSPEVMIATVVVFEEKEIEGKIEEVSIGSKPVSFKHDTLPEDMLPRIKAAAVDIEALADKAKETRAKLNEMLAKESND